ncbi:MAG: type II toxin-antitoxin system HicA family toxin [Campylobacterales bacterium]|nr:type II toxin-antitoxin system HicA family toxin [Campylobacterales bacterium]
MNAKELLKILKANGFEKVSQKGSHLKLSNGEQTTIVPVHGTIDIPIGTLKGIEKQTGLKF